MKRNKKVSVLIPAYNEEKYLGATLSGLHRTEIKTEEILVINDGSIDKTAEIAHNFSVKVINLDRNQGKGKAIERGIQASTGDIILLLDADLGESSQECVKLLEPLYDGDIKAVIAVLPVHGGGLGMVRMLAEYGLLLLTGQKMIAPLSGQRAYNRQVIDILLPLQNGFGLEMGMDIKLLRSGIKFREVECNFKHRVTTKNLSGFIHRGKQFWSILKTLWQIRS